ncbi:S24 family peptidase [Mannheimia haemolytica]
MKNLNEWFSITELLEKNCEGLPKTDKGISKKAEREGWEKRQREGVKGKTFEYHYSSFSEEVQKQLGFEPLAKEEKGILPFPKGLSRLIERLAQKVGYIAGFRSLSISAGYGDYNDGISDPDTYVPYSMDTLNRLGINENNGVVFWASGNSMAPTIDDGDQLLIDRNKQEITDGKIYVIQHRGTMWVKRIRWGFDEVFLVSDNEDYEPISIKYEDADGLQVVGQVVNVVKSAI